MCSQSNLQPNPILSLAMACSHAKTVCAVYSGWGLMGGYFVCSLIINGSPLDENKRGALGDSKGESIWYNLLVLGYTLPHFCHTPSLPQSTLIHPPLTQFCLFCQLTAVGENSPGHHCVCGPLQQLQPGRATMYASIMLLMTL